MKKFNLFLLSFWVFFLTVSAPIFSDNILESKTSPSNPKECLDIEQQKIDEAGKLIKNLEDHYIRMNWFYRKAWWTLYSPYWEAHQMTLDPMSDERQSEGEILKERFRYLADSYLETAKNEQGDLHQSRLRLKALSDELRMICASWNYRNCHQYWHQKVQESLEELSYLLNQVDKSLNTIDSQINKTTSDTPSDHVPFGSRIHEPWLPWHTQYDPQLMAISSNLKTLFESTLVKLSCHLQCTSESIESSQKDIQNPLQNLEDHTFGNHENVFRTGKTIGAALQELQETAELRDPEGDKKED